MDVTSMSTPLKSLRTGHVGINVTDLDRSRDFYLRVLGLEAAGGSEPEAETGADPDAGPGHRYALLAKDGQLLLTLWQQADSAHARETAGLHHLSFEVDTVAEVRAAEETLRAIGATFQYDGVVPHAETADSGGIFFTDPDGTRLEIFTAHDVAGEGHAPFRTAPTCGFF
jgi:lactoylglutathione lyase